MVQRERDASLQERVFRGANGAPPEKIAARARRQCRTNAAPQMGRNVSRRQWRATKGAQPQEEPVLVQWPTGKPGSVTNEAPQKGRQRMLTSFAAPMAHERTRKEHGQNTEAGGLVLRDANRGPVARIVQYISTGRNPRVGTERKLNKPPIGSTWLADFSEPPK